MLTQSLAVRILQSFAWWRHDIVFKKKPGAASTLIYSTSAAEEELFAPIACIAR